MQRRAVLMWLTLLSALPVTAGEAIRISGTGTGVALLEKIAASYLENRPDVQIQFIKPTLGSTGSIRALGAGRIDLAVSGRPPKPEEGQFRTLDYARTPLVFASWAHHKPQDFSLRDIIGIYAGKKTHWDDGTPVRLVLRSSFESDTVTLRAMSPEMASAVDDAFRRMAGPIGENDLDTITLIERLPGSLGPTSLGLIRILDRTPVVHRVDGVLPGINELAAGRYRLSKPAYLITRPQADAATSEFVAFLTSPAAKALLIRYEHLPEFR